MKKIKSAWTIVLIAMAVIIPSICSAQSQWARIYSLGTARSVQQTADSGYIVAGDLAIPGRRVDVGILKLDPEGIPEWQKAYGGSDDDQAHSIQETFDFNGNPNGYIVAGNTGSFGYSNQAWLLRLDTDGAITWQKTIGESSKPSKAYSVKQTEDGGYIVAGSTRGNTAADVLIVKLTASGVIDWQKRINGRGSGADRANSIQQTVDGGYIVTGVWINDDYWVLKLDSNGNVLWEKYFSGRVGSEAFSIIETLDQTGTPNGYIVAGEADSNGPFGAGSQDFWVLKLDLNGDISWQNLYGTTRSDSAQAIQQTFNRFGIPDGYIIAGRSDKSSLFLKLDLDGAIIWQRTLGDSGANLANSIRLTSDGGYITAGMNRSLGPTSSDTIWVSKLDDMGQICRCAAMGDGNLNQAATSISPYAARYTSDMPIISTEEPAYSTTSTSGDQVDAEIVCVPRPPVLDPVDDKTAYVGELLEFTVIATDPDGDVLTYSAINLPPGASFNPATQTFSWTPTPDQLETYSVIRFEVSDGCFVDNEDALISVASEAKLAASDATAYDWFGWSAGISGDTVIIGAKKGNMEELWWYSPTSFSSVYVFRHDVATWSEEEILTPDEAEKGDMFGYSVAISGDAAVVGAPNSTIAYIFRNNGANWTQEAIITPIDADIWHPRRDFGRAVAISGDTVVVGAYGDDHAGEFSGSAYVFKYNGTTWNHEAKLIAGDAGANDSFGLSVAIAGDTVVVGAPKDFLGGQVPGSSYVFRRNGATWTQEAKLSASGAGAEDLFGWAVAITGGMTVVGAPGDDHAGEGSGSAYMFRRSGATWIQEAKLTASDAGAEDLFGWSVAISEDTTVVGAPSYNSMSKGYVGSAYVFRSNGTTWVEDAKIIASDSEAGGWFGGAGDWFGHSIAISGDITVVGAPLDDDPDAGWGSGSAYVYNLDYNTPTGINVVVQPVDETTGDLPVRLTFSDVTQQGTTTLLTSDSCSSCQSLPSDLELVSTCFDLETSAQLSPTGTIEICIDYSGMNVADDSALELLHYENGSCVPVTSALDTINDIICGVVDSLSEFGIFAYTNHPPMADAGEDRTISAGAECRGLVTLDGTGSLDPDNDALTYTWTGAFEEGGGTVTGATPTVTLPLGDHTIALTVDDGRGGTDSDTVEISVLDTTTPLVTVFLAPGSGGDDDERAFRVQFSAVDNCDPEPAVEAFIRACRRKIPIQKNQVFKFERDDDCEIEWDDGMLEIEAKRAVLEVRATDAAGNVATTKASTRIRPGKGDGDDDDDKKRKKRSRRRFKKSWDRERDDD